MTIDWFGSSLDQIKSLIRQQTNLLYKLMGEPDKPPPKAIRGKFSEVSYKEVSLDTIEMLTKMIQFYREDD